MQEGEEILYSLHRSPFLGRKEGSVDGYSGERVARARSVMQEVEDQMGEDMIPENFGK